MNEAFYYLDLCITNLSLFPFFLQNLLFIILINLKQTKPLYKYYFQFEKWNTIQVDKNESEQMSGAK